MSSAFLIIDMQKQCKKETNAIRSFETAIEYINITAELFRSKDLPVIYIRDLGATKTEEDEGFQIVKKLDVKKNDIIIDKRFSNAFWETNLETILRKRNVEFVLISGFAAEYCVLFSYNGAVERGFAASLLQNGVAAAHSEEEAKRIQILRPTISYSALEYFLNEKK